MEILRLIPDKVALIESALGAIAMLLSFLWKPLNRKDRLGNPLARVCLAFLLLVCIVILIFDISEWWLLLSLLPLVYLIFRWQKLRAKEKLAFSEKSANRDVILLNFIDELSESELFEWEIKRFVLPHLVIYFEIGAILSLNNKLSNYESYSNDTHYAELKGLISAVKHNSSAMLDLMKSGVESDKIRKDKSYPLFLNNLYHAAMTKGDTIAIDEAFKRIETFVASTDNLYAIPIEILEAMMYRYDMLNDASGMSRTKAIISQRKPRNFSEYLYLGDIELFYNRRHNNHDAICRYLDETVVKLDKFEKDESKKLRFRLRIVALYVEFNYGWMEISTQIFRNASKYLSYSSEIAVEYLKMLIRVVRDAYKLHGAVLTEEQEYNLMHQAFNLATPYIEKYKTLIFNMDDRLLYKKRDGYRLLVDYEQVRTNITGNFDLYAKQLIYSYHEIISLCKKNEEYSELIRSLVVYIDEFLTLKAALQHAISQNGVGQNKEEAYSRMVAEEPKVKELFEELMEWLKKFDYDRACAYEILWTAHFCAIYNLIPEAKLHLQKFEEHKMSVKNYTKPIQDMYDQLSYYLKRM